jgi:hypothetical protein
MLFKNINIEIYKTVILPAISYWCETWFLDIEEEERLRVFEKSVHMRIFRPEREEITKW